MKDMPMGGDQDDGDTSAHVMRSMEGHMDMGPHLKRTALRAPRPGDAMRAQEVTDEARKVAEKYVDCHVALENGFKIFHPEIPQKMYHFTNRTCTIEAQLRFNPDHPTSLLYEKRGDKYKLIGMMYTVPKRFTEDQLDQRISPAGKRSEMLGPHSLFGFRGSIATKGACDAAGGRFLPVVFNWMVHVYPFEKDPANIWSVERQHGDTG